MAMLADLLKNILEGKWPQGADKLMEHPPTSGDKAGKIIPPSMLPGMGGKNAFQNDPGNVYDEQGNIVDYKPGGGSLIDMLSAGSKSANPFMSLLDANRGAAGQGTIMGLLSRFISPTPEANVPGQVQGEGKVGGGDPSRGVPGTGVDPALDPTPTKDQRVPALAGTPTPLPLSDQPPAEPPKDYSMPSALNPQQIEELRSSLLTQSGQMNADNPNSLMGRMSDPNSKVDQQRQMDEASDISNAVQPLQKADRLPLPAQPKRFGQR